MVRVNICGITRTEDARAAVNSGVNALGFIFAESKRHINPDRARQIIGQLPPFVTTVGVFVDEDFDEVRRILDYCRLDIAQLHGEESPEYCRELQRKAIKGFRIKDEESVNALFKYQGIVQGLLLDTYRTGAAGGTGETFDWSLAKKARALGPVILAGGINPQNVSEAISRVGPYAIDVSSGVESSPGIKDAAKIKKLMEAVRGSIYDA